MAQAAFCSVSYQNRDYKAVCKTEYSYVLNRFHDSAHDFHSKIDKLNQCLRDGTSPTNCGKQIGLDKVFENALSSKSFLLNDASPFEVEIVLEKVCCTLNGMAIHLEYAKDIELKEYDVLNDSADIKSILESLSFGIRISTDKSLILNDISKTIKLFSDNYDSIKQCLVSGTDTRLIACIDKLSLKKQDCKRIKSNLSELPFNIDGKDDFRLKMELRRRFNIEVDRYEKGGDHKADIEFKEYFCDENLNEGIINVLKTEHEEYVKVKWIWIKYIVGGVIILSVIVGIAVVFFKRKTAIKDEENMNELEDEIEQSNE